MKRFFYTDEMRGWMQRNYMLRLNKLAEAFNHEFKVNHSTESVNGFRKRLGLRTGRSGQFSKGSVPANKGTKGLTSANKGSFSKGNRPHNYRLIGTEAITKDGYIKVKVAEPNKWELKHRLTWEKHNGPVPKEHVIKFIDDNKQNCDIDNLMIISMREHAVINRHFPGAVAEHKHTSVQLAKIKLAITDRVKQRQDQC